MYSARFGVNYVDFNDPERPRTPKGSAIQLTKIFADNGFIDPLQTSSSTGTSSGTSTGTTTTTRQTTVSTTPVPSSAIDFSKSVCGILLWLCVGSLVMLH